MNTMTERYQFSTEPITCHSWNKDRSKLALSLNNNEVNIYGRHGAEWRLEETLSGHDLRVTGIDWASNTNRIVTCGADRNAYVWTLESDGKWQPTLVLLRINRAATCVKWAPQENKFAVGSGARVISVCYFEQENNWWVSKHIKKPILSTITTLDWHPNNILLAAGSADFKVASCNEYLKKNSLQNFLAIFPNNLKIILGHRIIHFQPPECAGGWVNAVAFSPDGNKVCWVGHDSSITVADATKEMAKSQLKTEFLPFITIVWVTPKSVVAAGHGCRPWVYSIDDSSKLSQVTSLDTAQKKEQGALSAMSKFKSLDRTARTDQSDTMLDTVHQNSITGLTMYSGDRNNVTAISSCGADSQLVIWTFKTLEQSIAELQIS
ncbi:unnamed protein product, partial [Meganyctiphanes norvegica]